MRTCHHASLVAVVALAGCSENRTSGPPPATPDSVVTDLTEVTGRPATSDTVKKVPYDEEHAQRQLKRAGLAAGTCNAATGADGIARGPWGKSVVKVTIGRNGHALEVVVAPDLEGTPTGQCVKNAFSGLIFLPYAAPSDAMVEWSLELKEPEKSKPRADDAG